MRRPLALLALFALVAGRASAQGGLGVQGFGYPTGQLSTRAAGTAGALGETDPGSALNPAALPSAGRSIFAFQFDPEFRSVNVGGKNVNTTTARFPLLTAGFRVFTKGYVAASFSDLLDRSWEASYNDSVRVAGDLVASKVSTSVKGAVADARLAFAWQFHERFTAGVGIHALTGANKLALSRTFTDSSAFGALTQNTTLAFEGSAISAGVVTEPVRHLLVSGSVRLGNAMRTRYNDSTAAHANVPNRYGISLTYDGIPGSQFSVRMNKDNWTRLKALGTSTLQVTDATEIAAGADIAGPKFQQIATQFRFGARSRDLPFGWNGHTVKESSIAGGFQLPFARGWAAADIAVSRNTRKAGGVTEQGTILSVGLTVRP